MPKQNNQKLLFISLLLIIGIFSSMVSNAHASINSGIKADLSISKPPALNQTAELTLSIATARNASNVSAKITLPESLELVSGDLSWHGTLIENKIQSIHAEVRAVKIGNWTIDGAVTGGSDQIYLSILGNEGIMSKTAPNITNLEFSKPAVSMNESGIVSKSSILSIKPVAPEGPAHINDTNLRPIRRLINTSSNTFNSKTNNFSEPNITITSVGTITIKGYIKYPDRNNQTQPAFGVTVDAYDDDWVLADTWVIVRQILMDIMK